MPRVLGNVLTQIEAAALRDAATEVPFEGGHLTAGRFARRVKANEQAAPSSGRDAILTRVREVLAANRLFASVARPRHFVRLMLSRYRPGMSYGVHVDDPIMAGARTDLSFTLFLSEPQSYEGGGLIIEDAAESRRFCLEAGDLLLYPTSALHRVEPVDKGERIAVVGWVQSWVRDPTMREILHDLDAVSEALYADQGDQAVFDTLQKARSNLYRLSADG